MHSRSGADVGQAVEPAESELPTEPERPVARRNLNVYIRLATGEAVPMRFVGYDSRSWSASEMVKTV